jgi:hypothetical protein
MNFQVGGANVDTDYQDVDTDYPEGGDISPIGEWAEAWGGTQYFTALTSFASTNSAFDFVFDPSLPLFVPMIPSPPVVSPSTSFNYLPPFIDVEEVVVELDGIMVHATSREVGHELRAKPQAKLGRKKRKTEPCAIENSSPTVKNKVRYGEVRGG